LPTCSSRAARLRRAERREAGRAPGPGRGVRGHKRAFAAGR
jgi:hypothetical protein